MKKILCIMLCVLTLTACGSDDLNDNSVQDDIVEESNEILSIYGEYYAAADPIPAMGGAFFEFNLILNEDLSYKYLRLENPSFVASPDGEVLDEGTFTLREDTIVFISNGTYDNFLIRLTLEEQSTTIVKLLGTNLPTGGGVTSLTFTKDK